MGPPLAQEGGEAFGPSLIMLVMSLHRPRSSASTLSSGRLQLLL